jgi:hypothetical protein
MNGLATIPSGQLLTKGSKLPEEIASIINFEGWARSIVFREAYTEPNPDFIAQSLSLKAIMADTIEEIWAANGVKKLQELLPDEPGASTGPLELTELYVAASDFESGNPTYVIITVVNLTHGATMKFTTGATNVQATLIGLLKLGHSPMRFQIKRGDSKDKGGRYLTFMLPPD